MAKRGQQLFSAAEAEGKERLGVDEVAALASVTSVSSSPLKNQESPSSLLVQPDGSA